MLHKNFPRRKGAIHELCPSDRGRGFTVMILQLEWTLGEGGLKIDQIGGHNYTRMAPDAFMLLDCTRDPLPRRLH